MHRVRLLRHHGIAPFLVFDGGPLPAKQGTEGERRARREEALARANALAAQGQHTRAREHYVKCVDVTPQMAYQLIKVREPAALPSWAPHGLIVVALSQAGYLSAGRFANLFRVRARLTFLLSWDTFCVFIAMDGATQCSRGLVSIAK